MWQPLLVFLKGGFYAFDLTTIHLYLSEHPNAWLFEAEGDKEDEDEDDESDHDDDDAAKPPPSRPSTTALTSPSEAYTEFLQFLATGCSGSPTQGYPTVILILSTIPSSVCIYNLWHPAEL